MDFGGRYLFGAKRADVWAALNDHIFTFLSGVTLAQLVERQRTKPVSVVRPAPKARESHPVSA